MFPLNPIQAFHSGRASGPRSSSESAASLLRLRLSRPALGPSHSPGLASMQTTQCLATSLQRRFRTRPRWHGRNCRSLRRRGPSTPQCPHIVHLAKRLRIEGARAGALFSLAGRSKGPPPGRGYFSWEPSCSGLKLLLRPKIVLPSKKLLTWLHTCCWRGPHVRTCWLLQ